MPLEIEPSYSTDPLRISIYSSLTRTASEWKISMRLEEEISNNSLYSSNGAPVVIRSLRKFLTRLEKRHVDLLLA